MAWVLWLAVPVLAPVIAALAVWLRSRPPQVLDAEDAMKQHQDYLSALAIPARGPIRTAPSRVAD